MQAKICPQARRILYRRQGRQAHPKIVIHGKIEGWVERADLAPQVCPPEGSLLRNMHITLPQPALIGLGGREMSDNPPIFINEIGIAIYQPDLGPVP